MAVTCIVCNCSVIDKPLHRTQPKGQSPNFMCIDCIKKQEPELAKNILEEDYNLINAILPTKH